METVMTIRRVAQAGKNDDPVWYRVHRRGSIYLTLLLYRAGIRPNQVSLWMMVLGAAGVVMLAAESLPVNVYGVALLYLSFVLDKVDGELARLRDEQTARGILLDRFHHRMVEPAIFIAAALHAYRHSPSTAVLMVGPIIMLLANIIDENQHVSPYIFCKRIREGAEFATDRVPPTAGWTLLASLLRPLKGFRMLIVALPLILVLYVSERIVHLPLTAWYLMTSAVALGVYLIFQCCFYYVHQLEADCASMTALFSDSRTNGAASAARVEHAAPVQAVPAIPTLSELGRGRNGDRVAMQPAPVAPRLRARDAATPQREIPPL